MAEQGSNEQVEAVQRSLKIFISGATAADISALEDLLKRDERLAASKESLFLVEDLEGALSGPVLEALQRSLAVIQQPEIVLPPRPKRDRKAEEQAAKGQLAIRATELRQNREAQQMEVTQAAQALMFCGLPYQPTVERQLAYRAKLANGSKLTVSFTAALPGTEMPFGSDRTLLQYLIDKAVKTKSRFVGWDTAVEYLHDMQMNTSGKNYADLRKRFERLRGLVIGVERAGVRLDATKLQAVISRSVLPTSIDARVEERGQGRLALAAEKAPYGIEFGQEFYDDFSRYHVPVPKELLRITRKQSQVQDICLFLHWRIYAAQSESLIPWESLREQMWHADQKNRRIRERFIEGIKLLREIWPEIQAEAREDGLWVAPPLSGRYLIPKSDDTRRLG